MGVAKALQVAIVQPQRVLQSLEGNDVVDVRGGLHSTEAGALAAEWLLRQMSLADTLPARVIASLTGAHA